MRQLETNANDLALDEGRLSVVGGSTCLGQTIKQRLQTLRGEWRYDLTNGIPLSLVYDKTDLDVLRAVYRECLLETPGVVSVEALSLSLDSLSRRLTITGTVRARDGSTVTFAPVRIDVQNG